jgi:integrase
MGKLEDLVAASERENTRRSYASAVRHFEVEWQGLLPATTDAIARYLADHSETLSINTLRQRLAALSRWHADHGFPDPTKGLLIRQVLRGIRSEHPAAEKQARSLAIDILQQLDSWFSRAGEHARAAADFPSELRHARNRSLVLLGFWRGFRSDEIVRLRVEDVDIVPGQGLTCYLGRSKGDRMNLGKEFKCPALSRMCPVAALSHWKALAQLESGPLYRGIDRWGNLAEEPLAANSLVPMLRGFLEAAGVAGAQEFSSHSLRRGFASWARDSGWDLKELMTYVGWRDVKSAMRYFDASTQNLQARFERGLPPASGQSATGQ